MEKMNLAMPIVLAAIVFLALAVPLVLAGCKGKPEQPAVANNTTPSPEPAPATDPEPAPATDPEPAPATDPEPDPDPMRPTATMVVEVDGTQFYALPARGESGDAFMQELNSNGLELTLHDYGGFEKTGPMPWTLPRNDVQMTAKPGDIVLYNGDQICIFYGENSWSYTRLASIEYMPADKVSAAFGDGDVTVRIWLEWTE